MEITSKSKINVVVFFTILLLFGLWVPSRFSFTRTESLSHRLFYLTGKNEVYLPRGAYVLFEMNNPTIMKLVEKTKTDKIIKKVVCTEGSTLKVADRDFFCDGQYIGTAIEYMPGSVNVSHFNYNGAIPEGSVFVMGNSPDSYDSRYFGFVEKKAVIARAYPIL